MPCNLLPLRKQVVPTALHSSSNTSAFKPPSCCGLDHSMLPSAMPGISLNGFSALTTFLGHFSALAVSAVALPYKARLLHSPQGRDQQEKSRDADAVTSKCYKPMSCCLFVLALAGGAWMLLSDLTSTPQIICIPKKASVVLWCYLQLCPAHSSSGSSTSCCWQGCCRLGLSGLGELDTGNQAKLLFITPSRSLDFSS